MMECVPDQLIILVVSSLSISVFESSPSLCSAAVLGLCSASATLGDRAMEAAAVMQAVARATVDADHAPPGSGSRCR